MASVPALHRSAVSLPPALSLMRVCIKKRKKEKEKKILVKKMGESGRVNFLYGICTSSHRSAVLRNEKGTGKREKRKREKDKS
jgi:hypothetical protein